MNTANALAVMTFTVDLHFTPEAADRAIQMLLAGIGRTEAKSTCRTCTVARDANEPNRVRYTETWNDETAFRKHVQSREFQHVLAAMDMCCEEPQVVIGTLSGRSGISYLQELRDHTEQGES